MQKRYGVRRASGNINVYGDNLVHAPECGVVSSEDSSADAVRAHCDHHFRIGCGVIRLRQRQLHVSRDGAGHQQHIGVAR